MNFASIDFFVFLSITYGCYRLLSHRWQNWLLLGASYFFYGAWDARFLLLIGFSTLLDFALGRAIYATEEAQKRKALLTLSVVANLGFLGFFKYFGFFTESFVDLLNTVGIESNWQTLSIILPVGISFYTFQTLSYTIDIYRRKLQPTHSLLNFAVFVAFFPQLVAGPIERASHFLPQVERKRVLTVADTARGCFLILLGLFKKVAIANGVSTAVDAIYNSTGLVGTLDVILATYLFAVQVYCDFSGYTDIARGVSKLLGFDLMINFDAPYFAINPSEFWRRWHISLSTWLRDYVYIPLGGNRQGDRNTYRNLMATMAIGGLWHGAAWNFVLWGVYQGFILCAHRLITGAKSTIQPVNSLKAGLRRTLMVAVFFQVTCYGWLLFRANSWAQIQTFTDRLFFHPVWSTPIIPRPTFAALVGILIIFSLDLAQYTTGAALLYSRWAIPVKAALYSTLIVVLLMGLANPSNTFIYFQF